MSRTVSAGGTAVADQPLGIHASRVCSVHTRYVLTDHEATQVLRALDSLAQMQEAAVKLVRAELACGPALDGLIADPLTVGTRLDQLSLGDTLAADLLVALGRHDTVRRLVDEAPAGCARDALVDHLAGRGSV